MSYPWDDVEKRVEQIYTSALKTAVKQDVKFKKIIKKIEQGKITAPQWYVDRGLEAQWYRGWIVQEMRNEGIIDVCARELAKAGSASAKEILGAEVGVYASARRSVVSEITKECKRFGYNPAFYQFNRREMAVLVQGYQTPFSKIAFRNIANAEPIKRRLEQSFGKAIVLGTGRDTLVEQVKSDLMQDAFKNGILDTAEQQTSRARTICQTEMNRIESEAQFDADQEALDQGIEMEREWHCRFQNTRDSHVFMEGQVVDGDEPFTSGDGNELRFPCDPSAPPEDTINCYCEVTRRVKSQSPALAQHREEARRKREEWLSKQLDSGEFNRWRNERDKNGELRGYQTWR